MQIDKLIPMNAFVLAEDQFISQFHTRDARTFEPYNRIVNYAKFLTQPITLRMFVPCDDKGNPLSEPSNLERMQASWMDNPIDDNFYRVSAYNKAKSKVLFEGWSVIGQDDNVIEIEKDNENIWIDFFPKQELTPCIKLHSGYEEDIRNIEQFIQYELTLTPTAKTLIYGR